MFKRNHGFTLIELLIVISIIAILISILMPALASARSQGSKLKCLANQRAIVQTALAYATDDPNGIFGPIHFNHNGFINEGYVEWGGGPGDMDYVNWEDEFDPRTRPLNILLLGTADMVPNTAPGDRSVFQVFQCPGDEFGWQTVPGFDSDDRETERSYFTANGTAFRLNNLKLGSKRIFTGVYGRPINRIPDTGATVGFHESRALQTAWTNNTMGSIGQNVEGGLELTSFHKKLGFFNLSYCDGHATFADMGNGTWYDHLQQFKNQDFRGTWGRMDCLPDPAYKDNDFFR